MKNAESMLLCNDQLSQGVGRKIILTTHSESILFCVLKLAINAKYIVEL